MSVQKTIRLPTRATKIPKTVRSGDRMPAQSSARQSRIAFIRAYPQLALQPELDRQWVLFVGKQQVSAGRTKLDLIQLCQRRKIQPGQYYIGFVDGPGSREVVERIDSSNCP